MNADAVAPDGSYVVHMDWSQYPYNLALTDLKSGQRRRLTQENGGHTKGIAVSPDSRTIVFAWNHRRDCTLRLVDADASNARILVDNPVVSAVRTTAWSPDGEHIAAIVSGKDRTTFKPVMVRVADGTVENLPIDDWQLKQLIFSPDGRFLAGVGSAQNGDPLKRIIVYDRNSKKTSEVVADPGKYALLGWTTKGDAVVYFRINDTELDVWSQQVKDGRASGDPVSLGVRIDATRLYTDRMQVLGCTQSGDAYYSGESWINDVYLVDFDPESGGVGQPERIVKQVGFDTSAHFSPDGKSLAYAYGYGRRARSMIIGIRSLETGAERRFPLEMLRFGSHAFQPHWSADGQSLLTQGRDKSMREGLFQIDVKSEAVTPLLLRSDPRRDPIVEWPSWSRNGATFYVQWTNAGPRRIMRLDDNTGKEAQIYDPANPAAKVSRLEVSPDGKQLAFVESDFNAGVTAVKVVSTEGAKARELVRLQETAESVYGQAVFALAWTHDSRSILYVPPDDQNHKLVLWQVSVQGGDAKSLGQLLNAPRAFGLTVRPDGRQLALTAGGSEQRRVWVLRGICRSFDP